jgi:hypothetical protein
VRWFTPGSESYAPEDPRYGWTVLPRSKVKCLTEPNDIGGPLEPASDGGREIDEETTKAARSAAVQDAVFNWRATLAPRINRPAAHGRKPEGRNDPGNAATLIVNRRGDCGQLVGRQYCDAATLQ